MERLKRMSVFAKVVELGSFTAAARQCPQHWADGSGQNLLSGLSPHAA